MFKKHVLIEMLFVAICLLFVIRLYIRQSSTIAKLSKRLAKLEVGIDKK